MSIEVNGYLLRERLPVITLGAAGPVGAAATTVDVVSHLGVTASAANLTFTLPVPSDTRSGRDLMVTNTGTNSFVILGMLIEASRYGQFIWDATENAWQAPALPQSSAADFFRSGSLTGLMPDGTTDTQDAIYRSGQVVIDTAVPGDGGLTLDDLRSRNSVQLTSGDAGVTDTNMTAIGVDTTGKVRLSNQLSIPDLRATNPAPQDYAAGFSNVFKQASIVNFTSVDIPGALPTYVNLQTTRRYANGTDFSGGQVRQDIDLEDGRQYFRLSTGATSWGPWTQESKRADDFDLQALLTLNGRARVSKLGQVSWDNQFRTMSAGQRPQETTGYHDIQMPAVGTTVLVSDGTTRVVAAATAGDVMAYGGIQLNAWETLWYNIRWGTNNATDATKFRIQRYQDSGTALNGLLGLVGSDASEWVIICQRDDSGGFRWGNGDTVTFGSIIGTSLDLMIANWTAMKNRVMGDGYFFSPGGNTSVPTAFGFTGTIRWINGGAQNFVNNNGYVHLSDAHHAIGVVAQVAGAGGVAGGTRTWRAMTAAEKPSWFGGALRGVNAINAATSAVIDLNDNEALYWVPDLISPSVGTWYIYPYTANTVPVHALPIAARQLTGGHSTIQVLLGGVQYALKAGDFRYTTTNDATIDEVRRNQNIQLNGPVYCRFTTANFFAGAAANGLMGGPSGYMISWDANRLMYGISDGYANFGNQYTWLEVPAAGTPIPVVSTGSNITRVVQTIGAHRYIPLGVWEALYWIPPSYSGGGNSADGDWVISYYGSGNQHLPPSAVMIAKAFSSPAGSGNHKTRIKFADGSYVQPGVAIAGTTFAENDQAQGSGDWRPAVAAGQTGPAMSAALAAVAGVANQGAVYKYVPIDQSPNGRVELDGGFAVTANVPDGTIIGFLPGVITRSSGQIISTVARHAGNNTIPSTVFVTFANSAEGGQQGTRIRLYGMSAGNVAAVNGGANGASGFVSIGNLSFGHA